MYDQLFLGWDIGGTKSSAVVVSEGGTVTAKTTWPSQAGQGPEAMLARFLEEASKFRLAEIKAVGVSVGGPLNPETGYIYSPPHLPGWDNFPLKDMLEERLQKRVRVEHDAAACLLAEYLWGNARNVGHAAYLTAGTGCGAALLNGGRILRGPNGQTTEIGHLRFSDDGPEVYGKKGSVEAFCSGTGIARLAEEALGRPTSVKELARMAAAGDEAGRAILTRAAQCMGRVCGWLSDLFAPEVIIIGSLATYLPAWWLDAVRGEWEAETLPGHRAHARICASGLQDRLQDLSAVAACVLAEQKRG